MNNKINNSILKKIKIVISKYIDKKDYNVFLFGSRVNWNIKKTSDYDVGIIWKTPLNSELKLNIEEEFENIPAFIDFVDFSQVSKDFKKHAMNNIIYLN